MLGAGRLQTAAKLPRRAGLMSPEERPSKRACAYHEAVARSSRTSRKAITSRGARPTIHAHCPRVPARHSSSWLRMTTHTCRWGLCREAAGRDQRMRIVGGSRLDIGIPSFSVFIRTAGSRAAGPRPGNGRSRLGEPRKPFSIGGTASPSPRRTRSPNRAAPRGKGDHIIPLAGRARPVGERLKANVMAPLDRRPWRRR